MKNKLLVTITIVERESYARRIAQRACLTQNTEILSLDPALASEIAAHLVEAGAEVRIVKEAPVES